MVRPVHRVIFPPILQIEPTNICNLRCLTCATGARMITRPPTSMPFEMFRSVIDQARDYAHLLVFWSWGEPFENRDAIRMIRYAKDQGLLVHTSTNGHFFHTRERAREVVDSGLDSLVVAVDGLDQATYEKYRKGGKLGLVIKSIENLAAERVNAGARHPLITFRFIVMKHNIHQTDDVKDFAKRLGADRIAFRTAVVQRSELNLKDTLAPHLIESQELIGEGLPLGKGFGRRKSEYCHRPYANLTVFSNGDVVSCENDFNATVPFGNVAKQSLREIMSSEQSKGFLKTFRQNLDRFWFCRECELREMEQKTPDFKTCVLNR